GILAALDTGIGSGSISTGWLIAHRGYRMAFAAAAAIAALALPYALLVAPRVIARRAARPLPDAVSLPEA
ncbi:MAG TPA: hypothetical protein VIL35_02715, partial [Vicinamibacterales bacterium]